MSERAKDAAARVLAAQAKTLIARVARGERLTASEQKILDRYTAQQAEPGGDAPATLAGGHSLRALAAAFGTTHQTLATRLREAGHDTGRGKEFTVRQAYEAMARVTDMRQATDRARLRVLEAEAALKELERQKLEHELVPLDEALAKARDLVSPLAKAVTGMPARLAPRVNPADPTHARAVLDQWARDTCTLIQSRCAPTKRQRSAKR